VHLRSVNKNDFATRWQRQFEPSPFEFLASSATIGGGRSGLVSGSIGMKINYKSRELTCEGKPSTAVPHVQRLRISFSDICEWSVCAWGHDVYGVYIKTNPSKPPPRFARFVKAPGGQGVWQPCDDFTHQTAGTSHTVWFFSIKPGQLPKLVEHRSLIERLIAPSLHGYVPTSETFAHV